MKCAVCGKETTVHDDGGIALMMAVCHGHNTALLNNIYCKECYETLIKEHLLALGKVKGMVMPGLEDEA